MMLQILMCINVNKINMTLDLFMPFGVLLRRNWFDLVWLSIRWCLIPLIVILKTAFYDLYGRKLQDISRMRTEVLSHNIFNFEISIGKGGGGSVLYTQTCGWFRISNKSIRSSFIEVVEKSVHIYIYNSMNEKIVLTKTLNSKVNSIRGSTQSLP